MMWHFTSLTAILLWGFCHEPNLGRVANAANTLARNGEIQREPRTHGKPGQEYWFVDPLTPAAE